MYDSEKMKSRCVWCTVYGGYVTMKENKGTQEVEFMWYGTLKPVQKTFK